MGWRRIAGWIKVDSRPRCVQFSMEPFGMVVLLKVAPVKSAPLVTALRRLASVKSVKRSDAEVRLALVKVPLVKSEKLAFA